jgi:hypothetical protein
MDTATDERPPAPAAERPVRPVMLALLATVLVVGLAFVAWGARESSSQSGELRAAFPDVTNPDWRCSSDEPASGHYVYGCHPSTGANGPTLNFEALPEPVTIEETIADVEGGHREAEHQNRSGRGTGMEFLGAEDWAPAQDDPAWGSVARWRYDNTQAGEVIYQATYRYSDKAFGVTVYASSPGALDDVVSSLRLPAPSDLPD